MRDTSLRIVSGVLGLRRFTIEDLRHSTGVSRSTVASWLRRHRDEFERSLAPRVGEFGRPHVIWKIKPEAESRYFEQIGTVAPALLAAQAIGGEAALNDADDRAITEAETYLRLARESRDQSMRSYALEWCGKWVDEALADLDARIDIGAPTSADAWKRIAHVQAGLRQETEVGLEMSRPTEIGLYERPDRDGPEAAEAVMEIARAYLSDLEMQAEHLFGAILPNEIPIYSFESADIRAAGMLAALGVLTTYPMPAEVKRVFTRHVHSVVSGDCFDHLDLARETSPETNWIASRAFIAICAGIENHPSLLRDQRAIRWLDTCRDQTAGPAPATGAYFRTRLLMGDRNWADILDSVQIHDEHDDDNSIVDVGNTTGDLFRGAERALVGATMDYYHTMINYRSALTVASHRLMRLGQTREAFRRAFSDPRDDDPSSVEIAE